MILFCVGTRPEWIKIKPVINLLRDDQYHILFTGQHTTLLENELSGIKNLSRVSTANHTTNRLDNVVMNCLSNFPNDIPVTSVLIQGDTASAYAISLAAFHRKIPIIHLEAGLRTYDIENPYPEESYRRSISCMSAVNLCATEISMMNLVSEKAPGKNFVVGNTVLDNLNGIESEYGNKILVTLHRRENHDMMRDWFAEVESLATLYEEYEFLIPLHPNPNVLKHRDVLKKVKVVDPMPHKELINYMSNCRFIITDSGGLQEESSFLSKKSIVCRKATERVEGLGKFSFLCESPDKLQKLFEFINNDHVVTGSCPYGDGQSSQKIKDIIENEQL